MRYVKPFKDALDIMDITENKPKFPCNINIGFEREENTPDEIQFTAEDSDDLYALWIDFCSEKNINPASVVYIQPITLQEFQIKITETYTRVVTVKAIDYDDASEKIENDINDGDIDLPCDGGEYEYSRTLEHIIEKEEK